MEHIKTELAGFGTITVDATMRVVKPAIISSYRLLYEQRLLEATPDHPYLKGFRKYLLLDPCLSPCAGPEVVDQFARWVPLTRWIGKHNVSLPSFAQVPVEVRADDDDDAVLRKRFRQVAIEQDVTTSERYRTVVSFLTEVESVFRRLGPEEWAAMSFLFSCHQAILFPLLLVTGQCTPQEYANGLMAADVTLATVVSDVTASAHERIARAYREDAQIVSQFLEHARCPWARDILKGEDDTREFKSTLRYDLGTGTHNPILEHEVLKNVAAFMNCQGGTVFVGVDNKGGIVGIELDGFSDSDKWALHLVTRIGQQIGRGFLPLCRISFDDLHGKTVARLDISPSQEPVFLDERPLKAQGVRSAFFVKGGPSAQKVPPDEVAVYIQRRFPNVQTSAATPPFPLTDKHD